MNYTGKDLSFFLNETLLHISSADWGGARLDFGRMAVANGGEPYLLVARAQGLSPSELAPGDAQFIKIAGEVRQHHYAMLWEVEDPYRMWHWYEKSVNAAAFINNQMQQMEEDQGFNEDGMDEDGWTRQMHRRRLEVQGTNWNRMPFGTSARLEKLYQRYVEFFEKHPAFLELGLLSEPVVHAERKELIEGQRYFRLTFDELKRQAQVREQG